MADVVQEKVPELKLEEETVLNGDAEEKEEVDPSEETAKKKKKKKKKKKTRTTMRTTARNTTPPSVRQPPTPRRGPGFSAAQVLEQIASSVDREDEEDFCDSEEEDVSEDEDGEEYDPERDADDSALRSRSSSSCSSSSSSCSSEEEEREGDTAAARERDREPEPEDTAAAAAAASAQRARRETLLSKNGKIKWSSAAYRCPDLPRAVRHPSPAVTPGPTAYAASRALDIESAFRLFVMPAIERIVVDMTNLQGVRKYGDGWRPMDSVDLRAYLGLLILAGIYRSRGEAAASLWESGRTVFRATMPLKVFHKYSRLLRFDDRRSRLAADRLAAIREVWDLWEERLPALYNPGSDLTVDEQLVPFRGTVCSYLCVRTCTIER
eukprot:XP_014044478.1 PREDICTED: uncharacterized protein LOC106597882 [Salmo salar]